MKKTGARASLASIGMHPPSSVSSEGWYEKLYQMLLGNKIGRASCRERV